MTRSAVVLDEAGTRIAWRTWQLVPEWSDARTHRPLLTGLAGFPWRVAAMDARCTQRDPAPRSSGVFTRTVDRHHRRVPAPECTCGIYASLDDLTDGRLPWSRSMQVVGFVALSGRLVADAGMLRAQHGTIVGPLAIVPPSPQWWQRGGTPQRVVPERHHYRVVRTPGRGGLPYGDWHAGMRHELAARYGVHVTAADRLAA